MTSTILRLPDVERRIGLSSSTIYAMMADGRFPRPIRIGKRAVGWPSDVVDDWVLDRPSSEGLNA